MGMNLYKDKINSVWYIYDDETETLSPVPFGAIVYSYIAHVLNMSDNGDVNLIYDENKEDFFKSNSLEMIEMKAGLSCHCMKNILKNTISHKKQAHRLTSILSTIAGKSPNECDMDLCHITEEFKWFGFNIVRDLPYNLSHDRDNDCIKYDIELISFSPDDESENEKHTNTNIKYVGVRYMHGSYCDLFHVDDFSVAFCLDLYAYLFDYTKKNYSIKLCSYCNRAFFAGKGNIKMCPACRGSKKIDRSLRNERARNDSLQNKVTKIYRYLDSISELISYKTRYDFASQLEYYKNKLKGKSIPYEPTHDKYDKELPIVSSRDDIVEWCDRYYQKLRRIAENGEKVEEI